ncbi:hypothetical protein [Bradyrhizobium sp. CB3481]|uniref:hypothetical protein n=1 Tax=Bradyrhizobium sp. CB3481 TaxID=3039158 RepID=UPI0024B20FCF|nr:hypothetical protein [Bradyrhizobium sp. CB3481]WFU16742.1 hypothetical protein QA643_38410 [Bradyrhizobium sp. CB3481]
MLELRHQRMVVTQHGLTYRRPEFSSFERSMKVRPSMQGGSITSGVIAEMTEC